MQQELINCQTILSEPDVDFYQSKLTWDKYMDFHNSRQTVLKAQGKQTLFIRRSHRESFLDLIHLLKRKINQHTERCHKENIARKTPVSNLLMISSNNKELSTRWKCNESTVYRQLKRLEQAGIIRKICHGPTRNYDIVFELAFLPAIYDLDNQYVCQITRQRVPVSHLIAKSQPYNLPIRTFLNNILIPVDKEAPGGESPNRNPYRTLEKVSLSELHPIETNGNLMETQGKHKPSEEKIQSPEQKKLARALQYAAWMVQFYIDRVMKNGGQVYAQARARAIEYVAETYFMPLNTYKQMEQSSQKFIWCLRQAARYAEKTENYRAPMPSNYFSWDNLSNGFRITWKWHDKQLHYNKLKKQKHRHVKSEEKFMRLLKKLEDRGYHLDDWNKARGYVQRNLPEYTDKFLKMTRDRLLNPEKM